MTREINRFVSDVRLQYPLTTPPTTPATLNVFAWENAIGKREWFVWEDDDGNEEYFELEIDE